MSGISNAGRKTARLALAVCLVAAPELAQAQTFGGMQQATHSRNGSLVVCKAIASVMMAPAATFTVTPGNLSATVAPKSCSSAMMVPPGTYVITEQPNVMYLVGCSTVPTALQVACNTNARTSTVIVQGGATTTATLTNDKKPASHIRTQ
jgi:hypothetical protein